MPPKSSQSDRPPVWSERNHPRIVLYEALTARVGHRDALLWQSPTLALTAQAFLLTIALGHESRPIARVIAAGLGLVVTNMSIQLMLKHRMYMNNDQVTMVSLEREMGLPTSAIDYETQLAYLRKDTSTPPLKEVIRKDGATAKESVRLWVRGLKTFRLVNILLLVFAFADMAGVPRLPVPVLTGEAQCLVML